VESPLAEGALAWLTGAPWATSARSRRPPFGACGAALGPTMLVGRGLARNATEGFTGCHGAGAAELGDITSPFARAAFEGLRCSADDGLGALGLGEGVSMASTGRWAGTSWALQQLLALAPVCVLGGCHCPDESCCRFKEGCDVARDCGRETSTARNFGEADCEDGSTLARLGGGSIGPCGGWKSGVFGCVVPGSTFFRLGGGPDGEALDTGHWSGANACH